MAEFLPGFVLRVQTSIFSRAWWHSLSKSLKRHLNPMAACLPMWTELVVSHLLSKSWQPAATPRIISAQRSNIDSGMEAKYYSHFYTSKYMVRDTRRGHLSLPLSVLSQACSGSLIALNPEFFSSSELTTNAAWDFLYNLTQPCLNAV